MSLNYIEMKNKRLTELFSALKGVKVYLNNTEDSYEKTLFEGYKKTYEDRIISVAKDIEIHMRKWRLQNENKTI